MTLDTCTQIPFSPIDGYLYAMTTLSGTDYSTTFSLESDCTATTGVNPNQVTEVIDTCTDLGIYIVDSWIAHSEKFSNAYDSLATITLDCTTTTVSATTTAASANDVAACVTAVAILQVLEQIIILQSSLYSVSVHTYCVDGQLPSIKQITQATGDWQTI